jgi:hypothetical protein
MKKFKMLWTQILNIAGDVSLGTVSWSPKAEILNY